MLFENESLKQKLAALFVIAALLAAAFSGLTYRFVQSVNGNTSAFVRDDVPVFQELAALKFAILRQETVFYEYYATTEREVYQRHYEENRRRLKSAIARLRGVFPDRAEVENLDAGQQKTQALADELELTLSFSRVDWDRARELLMQMTNEATVMNESVDAIILSFGEQVRVRGNATLGQVKHIVLMVVGFAIAALVLMLFAGYSVRAYLKEARLRRQLSLFPENNPHPILALDRSGRIEYANPGAMRAVGGVTAGREALAALLPPTIGDTLRAMAAAGGTHERFDYESQGRYFECEIHALFGFKTFHVYVSDVTERQRVSQRLIHQAYHDVLTGLPNRFSFEESVALAMASPATGTGVMALLISVDRMRLFIDSFGHRWGDDVLKAVAARLAALLEDRAARYPGSRLFRMDGAQFAILLPNWADAVAAHDLPDAIQAATGDPFRLQEREFFVTFSIGVATHPEDGSDPVTLVRNANAAMASVQQGGGDGMRRYSRELNERIVEALEIETDLRRALERGELSLHYQPQVRTADRRLVGFEALLRWTHPGRGSVSPVKFIPIAEETGLIVPIGEWVLESACVQAKSFAEAGLRDFTVSVNISARQFSAGDLPQVVSRALQSTGLDPAYLELEVTESAAMHDVARTEATLDALKSLGVRISIDDFGTGYSSLSYLKRFPVDKLKIDQSFVRNMTSSTSDAEIVRAMIALGHILELTVIAEGVETEEQRQLLADSGCEEIQGYLISRPQPAELLGGWMPVPSPVTAASA